MSNILQSPDKVLRQQSKTVEKNKIPSPEIKKVIKEMIEALDSQKDGVAIAAPQIGYNLRIFIISPKVFKSANNHKIFINPVIVSLGKSKKIVSEGCLSVRYKYGLVKRSMTASVRALNENGNEFVSKGRGLIAQIFQHEIDHLEGILFIDKATNIEDIPPEM